MDDRTFFFVIALTAFMGWTFFCVTLGRNTAKTEEEAERRTVSANDVMRRLRKGEEVTFVMRRNGPLSDHGETQ
jgi:hypothetical protein